MATYFITRHAGALDWAKRRGLSAARVTHLDSSVIQPGDLVLGTIPIQLVAAVNARGGRYLHLEIDMPAEARGRDLSADDMERYGARLQEFRAERVLSGVTKP